MVNQLAFAGLWDAWQDPEGGWLQPFSIITTDANELVARIHRHMPVILKSADYDRWLNRKITEQPPIDLLRPFDSDLMTMHPVDTRVGNVRTMSRDCVRRGSVHQIQHGWPDLSCFPNPPF